jgi:hypothetical protein
MDGWLVDDWPYVMTVDTMIADIQYKKIGQIDIISLRAYF